MSDTSSSRTSGQFGRPTGRRLSWFAIAPLCVRMPISSATATVSAGSYRSQLHSVVVPERIAASIVR